MKYLTVSTMSLSWAVFSSGQTKWFNGLPLFIVSNQKVLIIVATKPAIPPSPRFARTRKLKAINPNPTAVSVTESISGGRRGDKEERG